MSRPGEELPALTQLREGFREAARREIEAGRRTRPRRRRYLRPVLAAVGALVVAGGAATAADLIDVGAPAPAPERSPAVLPQGPGVLDVQAPGSPLPYGVEVYEDAAGRPCAIAGQVRAGGLGVVRNGTFRPYGADAGGPCLAPGRRPLLFDTLTLGNRTLFYGLARRGAAGVVARQPDGTVSRARTGRRGSFLLVFDEPPPSATTVTAVRADGSPLRR